MEPSDAPATAPEPATPDALPSSIEPSAGEIGPGPEPESPELAAPAPTQLTAADIAQANYQTFGPVFQQLAPKPEPPKHPWSDPKAYWNLAGVPEEHALSEFHRRQEQFAQHVADQRIEAALGKQREEFQRVLQGQAAYFGAQFARDPGFARIEANFNKYVSEGVRPDYARRLAEADAGIGRGAAPGGASGTGPRPAPLPPRHATSPATRNAPAAPPSTKWNIYDPAVREARFNALKVKAGYDPDD